MAEPAKVQLSADGITIWRTCFAEPGQVPQHVHAFDHLSMITAGSARIWADGVDLGVYVAPQGLVIKAGVKHRFDILEPGTIVDCVHNTSRSGVIETAR